MPRKPRSLPPKSRRDLENRERPSALGSRLALQSAKQRIAQEQMQSSIEHQIILAMAGLEE
jgi:hypothetical protein